MQISELLDEITLSTDSIRAMLEELDRILTEVEAAMTPLEDNAQQS